MNKPLHDPGMNPVTTSWAQALHLPLRRAALGGALLLSLAACSTTPPAPPPPEPVACIPAPTVALPESPDPLDVLLAYHQNLKALNPAELSRELNNLNTQPRTPVGSMRKAMVLSVSRNANDLSLAQIHLDTVLSSTDEEAEALKPLARVLGTQWTEQRRLADALDKLNAQARDNQRKTDQLNEKLEALKAIERTLPASPASPATAAPAAGASSVKQQGG